MDITWRKFLGPKIPKHLENICQIIFRALSVSTSVGIAAAVPDLESIIGLVGAICFSILGLFIPAIVEIVLCWDGQLGRFYWKLYKNIILAVIAIFALVSGTYQSISSFGKEDST